MATGVASTDFVKADSDGIDISGQINIKDNSFTILCWFNWDGEITGNTLDSLICWSGEQSATIHVYWANDNIRSVEQGVERFLSANNLVSTSTWYYVAATFDGGSGSGSIRVYFGEASDNVTLLGTSGSFDITSDTTTLQISNYNGNDQFRFDGKMAYVQIYDDALSIEQLQDIKWNPFSVIENNNGIYPLFDSSSGTDYSSAGIDGTPSGSPNISNLGPPVYLLGGQ